LADLLTVSDLIGAVFLLLPGFISINLIKHFGKLEITLSDFESTTWSLAGSLLIDLVFIVLLGYSGVQLNSIADPSTIILDPRNLIALFVLSVASGVTIGLFIGGVLKRGVSKGAMWDVLYSRFKDLGRTPWVIVYTSDGLEYQGKLFAMSKGKDIPREIVLFEPTRLIRDEKGSLTGTMDIGKELLLKEDAISSISFDKPLFYQASSVQQDKSSEREVDVHRDRQPQEALKQNPHERNQGGTGLPQDRLPAEAKLNIGKLDDAFLFVLALATLGFTIVQTSVRGPGGLVVATPVLLSGVALPFYVGFWRGAVTLNSDLERVRGWTILVMGNFIMLALLITDYTALSWPLYAVSIVGIAVSMSLGIMLASAYPLVLNRRTKLVLAGGAATGFFFPIVAYLMVNEVAAAFSLPTSVLFLMLPVFSYLVLTFVSILISTERTCEVLVSDRILVEHGGANPKGVDVALRELSQHLFFGPLDYLLVLIDPVIRFKRILSTWILSFVVLISAGYIIIRLPGYQLPVAILVLIADSLMLTSIILYIRIRNEELMPKR
jgi:Family of unknown function (DUF6338)